MIWRLLLGVIGGAALMMFVAVEYPGQDAGPLRYSAAGPFATPRAAGVSLAGTNTWTGAQTYTNSVTFSNINVALTNSSGISTTSVNTWFLNIGGANGTYSIQDGDFPTTKMMSFVTSPTAITLDTISVGTPFGIWRNTITASTTQTLAAATVCPDICNVGTVANASDAVKLGLAMGTLGGVPAGRVQHIVNQGANTMLLFPDAAGSKICVPTLVLGAFTCGAAGASLSVVATEALDCVQYDTTADWFCH